VLFSPYRVHQLPARGRCIPAVRGHALAGELYISFAASREVIISTDPPYGSYIIIKWRYHKHL
jgi:hypothetical protein